MFTILSAHLVVFCSFIDGDTAVFLVFLCISTNNTDELLIILTEKFQFFIVDTANLLRSWSGPLVLLLSQVIREVSKSQIRWGLSHREYFLTHWARLMSALPPPLLKTVLTEAVAAQQENRVLKYITTHRAGAVSLRLWYVRCHSVFSSVLGFFLSRLRALSSAKLYFRFHRFTRLCWRRFTAFRKQIVWVNTNDFPV